MPKIRLKKLVESAIDPINNLKKDLERLFISFKVLDCIKVILIVA